MVWNILEHSMNSVNQWETTTSERGCWENCPCMVTITLKNTCNQSINKYEIISLLWSDFCLLLFRKNKITLIRTRLNDLLSWMGGFIYGVGKYCYSWHIVGWMGTQRGGGGWPQKQWPRVSPMSLGGPGLLSPKFLSVSSLRTTSSADKQRGPGST